MSQKKIKLHHTVIDSLELVKLLRMQKIAGNLSTINSPYIQSFINTAQSEVEKDLIIFYN